MAKIENTTVYPLVTPNASDFVIGTDTSNDNRTVSFSISDITASGGFQNLQSVLDTPTTNAGGTAAGDITLTGNITVDGYIYPTQIRAQATPGSAGQILSSTGTGIEWIAAAGAQDLQDVIAVDPNTTLGFVMDNCDIDTTGSINMSGSAKVLALSTNTDMTLAANCDITTDGDIILGSASVLNFNATSVINDASGATGIAGQVLTVDAAGTGVEWSTGIPTVSMPTLQEVLTEGNTALGVGINLTSISPLILDASSSIVSSGQNAFSGNNTFSANGTTTVLAGVNLTGSVSDGVGTGASGQVLTSTVTGVSWADLSTIGVSSVNAIAPASAASSNTPITITPTSGAVEVRQNIYNGGSLIGCVPAGGTAGNFLQGNGSWAAPPGAVSTVTLGASGVSTSSTNAIKVLPNTGNVIVSSNAFDGSDKVGHVPSSSAAVQTTTFLRADGTWEVPAGGSSGGFGGLQTFLLSQAKQTVVANNYMTLAVNNISPQSDRTVFSTDLGATAPDASPFPTDKQHVAGCFLSNPPIAGCMTATPAMKCCNIHFTFLPEFGSHTLTVDLWKTSLCTSGTYTKAGSVILTANIDTLECGEITFINAPLQTLQLGEAFFITVQSNAALTANDFTLNTTIRYEMVA